MNYKPHHIALTVNNIDESIAWYKNKLGFEVVHRYEKHGMEIAHIKLGEVRMELFCYGQNTKPLPDYRRDLMEDLHVMGTKHICIEVEDLDLIIKQLKKRGVEIIRKIDTAGFGGRYTFIKDCDDILIELYEA